MAITKTTTVLQLHVLPAEDSSAEDSNNAKHARVEVTYQEAFDDPDDSTLPATTTRYVYLTKFVEEWRSSNRLFWRSSACSRCLWGYLELIMVVPLSGSFTLGNAHLNAGGTLSSQVSMNDSDIRALANDFSGEISMSQMRGGTTITQGNSSNTSYGYSEGIGTGSAFGSIADDDIFVTGRVMGIFYVEIVLKGTTSRTFFRIY